MRTALFLTKGLSLGKGEKPSFCQNSVPLRYAAPDFDKCAARGVTFGHGQTQKVNSDTDAYIFYLIENVVLLQAV